MSVVTPDLPFLSYSLFRGPTFWIFGDLWASPPKRKKPRSGHACTDYHRAKFHADRWHRCWTICPRTDI